MKLNNLSRLTALLLAIVLFLSSIVYAETTGVDSTIDDYNAALTSSEEYMASCTNWAEVCAILQELAKMAPSERYGYLLEMYLDSEDGASLYGAIQMHHYYGHYLNGEYTDLLCMCNDYEADFTGYWLAMYPYGDKNHNENCPWHIDEGLDFGTGRTDAQTFVATAEADREAYVAGLTDTELYDMLDVLGWRANTTLASGDVTVKGVLPKGTALTATELTGDKVSDDVRDFILEQANDETDYHEHHMAGYEVTLDFYGREIEPKEALMITYYNANSTYYDPDCVVARVLHVLESVDSIEKESAKRNVYYSDSDVLVSNYGNDAALAAAAAMDYDGYVAYTLEYATPLEGGHVTFMVDSLSSMSVTLDNTTDSAGHFVTLMEDGITAYFYWRLEGEQTTENTDRSHVKVTVSSNSTNLTNESVPHGLGTSRATSLLCNTIIGYNADTNTFADGTTVTWTNQTYTFTNANAATSADVSPGAFTINITTDNGWVITSYRIGCEGERNNGETQYAEDCSTVEAQNLTVEPDEDGNYKSNITISTDARAFGHGSQLPYYVLILTVEQVSINIDVEKNVSPQYVTYTEGEETWLYYEVSITNNSTNNISYQAIDIEDTFFTKGATITDIELIEADGTVSDDTIIVVADVDYTYTTQGHGETDDTSITLLEGKSTTAKENPGSLENATLPTTVEVQSSGGSHNGGGTTTVDASVTKVVLNVQSTTTNEAFWAPGETITIKYKYLLTSTDAEAGILPNTVFVTAYYDPEGDVQIEDFNTAYVEVLISDDGFGSMQVHKKFEGLSALQVSQLLASGFTISVTPDPNDATVASPTIGTVTKVSDTEYYWNVTGLVVGAKYTVEEVGYKHPDFAVPTSTIEIDCYASGSTTVTANGTAATGTSGTTAAIASGDVYQVYFTNTYTSGDLAITKQATTHNEEELSADDLADMQFPFVVTFTQSDGTALTAAYDYTITNNDTTVSTGKVSSGGVIWLTPGQTATVKGLPDGVAYEVTEANVVENTTTEETGDVTYGEAVTGGTMSYYSANTTDDEYEFTVTSSGTAGKISAGTTQAAVITNIYGQSTGSLTITKTVEGSTANEEDTFIFTIAGTGVNMQVVLKAGQSVTINDLPAGDYTVTEDTSWSWRYTLSSVAAGTGTTIALVPDGAKVTVPAGGNGAVTFTNKVTNNQWLDGSAYADNAFTDSGVTRVD